MSRTSQDVLLFLFGVIMLRLGVSDLHLRFVKPGMQPLIVLSAVVLLVLVAVSVLQQVRASSARQPSGRIFDRTPAAPVEDEHAGHGHEHGAPRTSWLLALPLIVLLLVAPPPLGADAVRRSVSTAAVADPGQELTALPAAAADGALELSLGTYANRAQAAPETLQGATLRLTGFVVHEGDGWLLARLSLSCCAADGRPTVVRVTGPGAASVPQQDSWVEVTGRWAESGPDGTPTLQASSTRPVPEPSSPYESR